jgi:hypothetical protein
LGVLMAKTPCNLCNPRLMNYLHAFGIFTTVESALQNHLFMQNEPNFPESQMNVNKVIKKNYGNKSNWTLGENEPKTNPNEPKFKKAEMNVTSYITKAYENKQPFRAPKKQSQTSKRQKPMQTSLPQRIMKKTAISPSDKTNPNKPNQTQPVVSLANLFQRIFSFKNLYSSELISFPGPAGVRFKVDGERYVDYCVGK